MDAQTELWLKRKDVMVHEDKMNDLKEDVDEITINALKDDDIISGWIEEHNELSASFEKEVAEATKHLEEKLQIIQKEKAQIYQYKNYLLGNNKELSEMVDKYTETTNSWKRSITKYTMELDKFVNSGEVKDV